MSGPLREGSGIVSKIHGDAGKHEDTDSDGSAGPTTVELLKWGWNELTAAPELLVPFVAAALLATATQAGITVVSTEFGTAPEFAVWVWPVYLLAAIVSLVGLGGVFLAVADEHRGVERSHTHRLQLAARRVPSIILAAVIGAFPVVAGYLVVVLPGLYFTAKLAFAFPACVINDVGAVTGLRQSFVATSGHARVILTLVLTFVVSMIVVSAAITFRFGQNGVGYVGPLVQNLVTAVLVPLFGLVFGRLYVARR